MIRKYSIQEYFQSETLREASDLLTLYPEKARLLAGGVDLLNQIPQKRKPGVKIVSLNRISELRGISQTKDREVRIGALKPGKTTMTPGNKLDQFGRREEACFWIVDNLSHNALKLSLQCGPPFPI